MGAATDTFVTAMCIVAWFIPWHVPAMGLWRLRWTDRVGLVLAAATTANLLFVLVWVVARNWPDVVSYALRGGSAAYALWRAWREHRPPRRRLRDKAAAAVQRMVERMQPARAPIPVRAFGGA